MHEKQKHVSGKEPEPEGYVTGSEVANPCVRSSAVPTSIDSALNFAITCRSFDDFLFARAPLCPPSNAVVSVASTITSRPIVTSSASTSTSTANILLVIRDRCHRFSAAAKDVAEAPTTFTMTLIRSRSCGMFDSGHWRKMASCAVLRTIGSRKLPPEARRIPMTPVGVVDVAAVG